MAFYICQMKKKITLKKVNEYCLLQRCPELFVRRHRIVRGRLAHIDVRVVCETLTDIVECK